jgi:hypothetical protein
LQSAFPRLIIEDYLSITFKGYLYKETHKQAKDSINELFKKLGGVLNTENSAASANSANANPNNANANNLNPANANATKGHTTRDQNANIGQRGERSVPPRPNPAPAVNQATRSRMEQTTNIDIDHAGSHARAAAHGGHGGQARATGTGGHGGEARATGTGGHGGHGGEARATGAGGHGGHARGGDAHGGKADGGMAHGRIDNKIKIENHLPPASGAATRGPKGADKTDVRHDNSGSYARNESRGSILSGGMQMIDQSVGRIHTNHYYVDSRHVDSGAIPTSSSHPQNWMGAHSGGTVSMSNNAPSYSGGRNIVNIDSKYTSRNYRGDLSKATRALRDLNFDAGTSSDSEDDV